VIGEVRKGQEKDILKKHAESLSNAQLSAQSAFSAKYAVRQDWQIRESHGIFLSGRQRRPAKAKTGDFPPDLLLTYNAGPTESTRERTENYSIRSSSGSEKYRRTSSAGTGAP
jgi:hypothetical protein